MAQRITDYQNIPYAQEALTFSSTKRGLGAMTLETRPNMTDGGNRSKPASNSQDQAQYDLAMQNVKQNAISAQPQRVADAIGQSRNMMSSSSTQESRAKQYLNQNLANQIEAGQTGGAGIMKLNSIMQGPERSKFVNDIKVSSMMAEPAGQAPELGRMMEMANNGGNAEFQADAGMSSRQILDMAESRSGSRPQEVYMNGQRMR